MGEQAKINRAASAIEPEPCENCGRVIGKLETPMLWQERVVCDECHSRLANKPAPSPAPVVVVASPLQQIAAAANTPRSNTRLTSCPICKSVVSPAAASCPSCGHPMKGVSDRGGVQAIEKTAKRYKGAMLLGFLMIFGGVAVALAPFQDDGKIPAGIACSLLGGIIFVTARALAWWHHG